MSIAKKISPVLWLLSLGILWGSGYSLAHFATTHGVMPLGYSFWEAVGPALVMLLTMLVFRWKIDLSMPSIRLYAITGLIGIALPNSAIYFAAAHLPAGLLAVIVNTIPLFTFILAYLSGEETPRLVRVAGIICCLLGLAILLIPGSQLALAHLSLWVLLALVAPLCFASCVVLIASRQPDRCSAMSLATGMLVFASIWLIPAVVMTHSFYRLGWVWHRVDLAIVLEIILSSLGYVIFCHLLRLAGAVYYSLVGGVVAIVGLIWGFVFFGEHLTHWQWLAVIFILMSIMLLSIYKQQKNKSLCNADS